MKINISFKRTKKDLRLLKKIMELEEKSNDIKKILYQYFFKENY